MTLDLDAIRAAISGATKLPWRFGALEYGGRGVLDATGYLFAQVDDDGNGRFIAMASQQVPALLAEVERLRGLLREACDLADVAIVIARSTNEWRESRFAHVKGIRTEGGIADER